MKTRCTIILGAMFVCLNLGCEGVEDFADSGNSDLQDEGRLQSQMAGIFGRQIAQDCTVDESLHIFRSISAGAHIAKSIGFSECLDDAIRNRITTDGGAVIGPYQPFSGDPYRNDSITEQIKRALWAASSTNNIKVNCTNSTVGTGSADLGDYFTLETEVIALNKAWRNGNPKDDSGTYSSSPSVFFQHPRTGTANLIWHEAMHQRGYNDDASADRFKAMSYIVGNCLSHIGRRSSRCDLTCRDNMKPVARHKTNSGGVPVCDCVDDPTFDIGLIMDSSSSCPAFAGRHSAEEVTIRMDDEDGNNDSYTSGWVGRIESGVNTKFRFCRTPGMYFDTPYGTSSEANYAVIQLGGYCPPKSVNFLLRIDNEDDDNNNWYQGHIVPNHSDRNTILSFCMYKTSKSGSTSPFPRTGRKYGVFGGTSLPARIESGVVYSDDEDSQNNNALWGNYVGSSSFLTSGKNTKLRTARVR